jgi:type I restriction enzyme R subunit
MNEAETRTEHIDPALKAAGWGVVEGSRFVGPGDYPKHALPSNAHGWERGKRQPERDFTVQQTVQ